MSTPQLPDFGPLADDAVEAACNSFPATFGLRAYPGDTFRVSASISFVSRGAVVLYTQRQLTEAQYAAVYGGKAPSADHLWVDFAKGSPEELRAQIPGDATEQNR